MNFKILMLAALVACSSSLANAAVLATVGDRTISDEQIKTEYDAIGGDQKKAINADSVSKRNMIDTAVNAEVMFQAAKKAGLENDEEFKAAVENFKRQYLASKFMRKAVEPKLTRDGIKKFFEDNKSFFDTSEVCAHHIVVTDEDEAKDIFAKAKAKGANFEALAKKYSADPTVQENHGNLGCFSREKMVPEFAATAFAMKKGEVKGPVRTMYGYHIIKLDGLKPGKLPNYDEVEQRVKETYRLKLVSELIQDLRAKSNVKVNEEEVKKFKL